MVTRIATPIYRCQGHRGKALQRAIPGANPLILAQGKAAPQAEAARLVHSQAPSRQSQMAGVGAADLYSILMDAFYEFPDLL